MASIATYAALALRYQVGDVGTVLKVLKNPTGGNENFYVVAMDKNHLVGGGMAFSEEEFKLDV